MSLELRAGNTVVKIVFDSPSVSSISIRVICDSGGGAMIVPDLRTASLYNYFGK